MADPRLKLYQFLMWKRHSIRTAVNREEHELRYLFFEVSRRCNIHCRYCGSGCTLAERQGEMSAKEWIDIIDQLAEDYDPSRVMIAVTGGEPLFKEGIYDIFKHLDEKGFPYGMVTNSTLLTPEAAKKLVECGIDSISLSLDSIPEINDSIRGKGTAAAAVKAIKNLRDAGYKGILEALSTITKPCMDHLEEMQAWLTELGLTRWRVSPVIPIGRAAENKDLLLNDEDIEKLLLFVRRQRRNQKAELRLEFSEEGYLGDRFEGLVRPYLCQCRAGINVGGIRYDGKIGACPEISQTFDQGDIHEARFSKIWNERFQAYRDRSWTRKLGPCRNCDKYNICHGGAMHLYENTETPTQRCFYKMIEK
ncbi:MAG: radical SAM protein [Proteobacteria bacterium]|jgi:radical SAM protein with 4Fe4S-binding SPASM domain|nr:radical SAM protein [Pseudomonadota bacterium]